MQETGGLKLSDILDGTLQLQDLQDDDELSDPEREETNELPVPVVANGFCVECEDQPAQIHCEQCTDDFCEVCYSSQHRKGTRKKHTGRQLFNGALKTPKKDAQKSGGVAEPIADDNLVDDSGNDDMLISPASTVQSNSVGSYFLERAKYIPLRLTLHERKLLRLLEAALNVSEYTDKIDVIVYSSKTKRIVAQIRELCAILSGLVMASDYRVGQELFQDRNFEDNADFLSALFELGRRHKIMNPDKMRESYGKLVYLLQDSQMHEVKEILQFSCVVPIKTVYAVLEAGNCLGLLTDALIVPATKEIFAEDRSRYQIQQEIKSKESAIEQLARRYGTKEVPPDMIRQCLYSMGDNHSFLRVNRDPCDKMIQYLSEYFSPNEAERGYSLSISHGRGGARLSHDHEKQYHYVHQSLSLWREIQHEMFMLWSLAENDLLQDDNMYRLRDTGQGLNRVQSAPRVSRVMHTILHRAQQKVGNWIGSSVIHLGDHNVPNALMFIDKYTQIFHILLPICNCLSKIPDLVKDPGLNSYIEETFGGVEKLTKDILVDFFRHAFDGSGADNFFDAGSCIDGRLTSAWNWCSKIEKKAYFPVFLLTGFIGFDGKF